jgi:hypothetical protein
MRARIIAAAVLAGIMLALGTARALDPDPSGVGTHTQLGFHPCPMVVVTGYPCPTCGMTTSWAYMTRGAWLSAFHAQPAGLALGLAAFGAAGLALSVLVTGKVWLVNAFRVRPWRVMAVGLSVLLGGWAYKIATGVMAGTLPFGPFGWTSVLRF